MQVYPMVGILESNGHDIVWDGMLDTVSTYANFWLRLEDGIPILSKPKIHASIKRHLSCYSQLSIYHNISRLFCSHWNTFNLKNYFCSWDKYLYLFVLCPYCVFRYSSGYVKFIWLTFDCEFFVIFSTVVKHALIEIMSMSCNLAQ